MGYYARGCGQIEIRKEMKVSFDRKTLSDNFHEVIMTADGTYHVEFFYENYYDDEFTNEMRKLAPYIEFGDVEFIGDDDSRWRFHFYKGTMEYQVGRTIFEASDRNIRHSNRLELLGCMADIVDDWLEERLKEKGLIPEDIQCEDRAHAIEDGEDPEGLAITYGEDYDRLTEAWEDTLINYGLLEKEDH